MGWKFRPWTESEHGVSWPPNRPTRVQTPSDVNALANLICALLSNPGHGDILFRPKWWEQFAEILDRGHSRQQCQSLPQQQRRRRQQAENDCGACANPACIRGAGVKSNWEGIKHSSYGGLTVQDRGCWHYIMYDERPLSSHTETRPIKTRPAPYKLYHKSASSHQLKYLSYVGDRTASECC